MTSANDNNQIVIYTYVFGCVCDTTINIFQYMTQLLHIKVIRMLYFLLLLKNMFSIVFYMKFFYIQNDMILNVQNQCASTIIKSKS